MNEIRARWILMIRAGAALGFGLGFAPWGWSTAVGGALLGAFGWVLVIFPVFLALRRLPRPVGLAPPSWSQCVRAAVWEWGVFERTFSWQQPFRSRRHDNTHVPPASPRRGVLLLHGFRCNRGLWNDWMRRYEAAGVPFEAINLEPASGSIDAYAETIDSAISRLTALTGQSPLVVAHSMGGLAIRAWRRATRAPPERVHHVLTLGSPHQGTLMAGLSRVLTAQQMAVGSDWLAELAATESLAWRQRFTCVFSLCDEVVCPATRAVLPDAQTLEISASGHLQLLDEPRVWALVEAWLRP